MSPGVLLLINTGEIAKRMCEKDVITGAAICKWLAL
jgi:ATP-dependent exoDNAse (exonuclease V) alpha subunit